MKTKSYSIAWTEFDRNDYLVSKRKDFNSEQAMKNFAKRLEQKNNFNEIIAIA